MRYQLLLVALCGVLAADGGMFVPDQWEIWQPGQVAIIKWTEGREELMLASQFSTYAPDLAWLVPLPAEPRVDTVPTALFHALERHCAPIERYDYGTSCGGVAPTGYGRESDSGGLREIGSGVIGAYGYQLLWALTPETLETYLTSHGYRLPDNTRGVFEHYLNQGWNYFFVARLVDSTLYYYSASIGVRLSFASDSIVYPLYVSRISSTNTQVILYVLAEHRQMFRGAYLRFSGRVDEATFSDFPDVVDREYHLTKLTKVCATEQMQDVCFRNAPDDQEYREIRHSGGYRIMPLGLLFGVWLVLRRGRSSRRRSRER